MQTVSKFIINRDDNKFLYVEKYKLSKKSDRMKYFVHSSPENVTIYSDHTFHSVHSLDEKLSVKTFSKKAVDRLITELYDETSKKSYDLLSEVYNKTSSDPNILNPNIKKVKKSLLKGMKIYNELFQDFEHTTVPYEENYELLKSEESNSYVKQKVKNISSLVSKKEIEENPEEIYSIPVKELVRIKKSA